mmetsp:Transcript_27074/g.40732  ORF Transcript_27074/g.40732 Transcript_27074/m.40732 type:complete len:599 (-) Transcript_27074:307-2103(-)
MEDKLERVNKRLKDARDDLDKHLEKAQTEEKRLQDKLHDIDERKRQCAAANGDVNVSDDDVIEINAGGKIIAAKRGVLTQLKGTRFEALFCGRWEQKLQRDSSGRIFLDVNPKAFRAIVDWLNVRAISTEDDCPESPTMDEENEGILRHYMRLFFTNSTGTLTNIESVIIKSENYAKTIHDWLSEDDSEGVLSLVHRSSRDGSTIDIDRLESNEDGSNGRALVIIETTEGHIIGGYTNAYHLGLDSAQPCASKSFLFTLCGFDLTSPCKMKVKNGVNDVTVGFPIVGECEVSVLFHNTRDGDFFIYPQALLCLRIGSLYECGPSKQLLQSDCTIKEMEIFQVSDCVDPQKSNERCHSSNAVASNRVEDDIFPAGLSDAIKQKWRALEDMEAEILSLEDSFTDEERFIESFASGCTSDIVILNVSGTMMVTKRATLLVVEESMLAQQFDDSKWTEQGSNKSQVKQWTTEEVVEWVSTVEGIQDDVSNLFMENKINGSELLALDKDGLQMIGVKRVGTLCLLFDEIKSLKETVGQDVATLIEHSPYCFGKILDYLRLKHLNALDLTGLPPLPTVCDRKKETFDKVVKYYFPGNSSKLILG